MSDQTPDNQEHRTDLHVGDTDPETGLVVQAELVDEVDAQGNKTGRKVHTLSGIKPIRLADFKSLDPWKRRATTTWIGAVLLIGIAFLVFSCNYIVSQKNAEQATWWHPDVTRMEEVNLAHDIAEVRGATHVQVGTYLENIETIDLKNSKFTTDFIVWFKWDGDKDLDMLNNFSIYKGDINNIDVLDDTVEGTIHYQRARVRATITKTYATVRFPLASNQINIYVESGYDAADVIFDADKKDSAVNGSLSLSGFEVSSVEWGEAAHEYASSFSTPDAQQYVNLNRSTPVTSEFVTSIIVHRNGLGLYFKCFLAMYGTTLWSLVMIYICANHHVDTMGMIPGALFGTVSNIMVGASLIPDALSLGLLEFANVWGIITILMAAMSIIQTNNIRSEHGRSDERFARFFGHAMFWTVSTLAIAGNIILPVFTLLC